MIHSASKIEISLKSLIVIWMISFPIQGAFFQASIYLLPVCVFSMREGRRLVAEYIKKDWPIFVMLLSGIIISYCINVLGDQSERFESLWTAPFDPVFQVVWRIAVFGLCLYALKDIAKVSLQFLMGCLFFSAIIHCLASFVMDYSLISKTIETGKLLRVYGTVDSPNELGVLMALGFWSGGVILCCSQFKARFVSFLIITGMIILLAFLLLSGSRGAWMGFILSCFFVVCGSFYFGVSKKIVFVSFIILVLLAIVILTLGGDIFKVRIERLMEDDIRIGIWGYFLDVWRNNFIFGVYDLKDFNYLHTNNSTYRNPHSVFLDVLVRTGLVGFIGFILYLFFILRRLLSSRAVPFLAMYTVIVIGTSFSFSVYGKEFAQILYALLLIIYLFLGAQTEHYDNKIKAI